MTYYKFEVEKRSHKGPTGKAIEAIVEADSEHLIAGFFTPLNGVTLVPDDQVEREKYIGELVFNLTYCCDRCDKQWDDQWPCACNAECSVCGVNYTPDKAELVFLPAITHVRDDAGNPQRINPEDSMSKKGRRGDIKKDKDTEFMDAITAEVKALEAESALLTQAVNSLAKAIESHTELLATIGRSYLKSSKKKEKK